MLSGKTIFIISPQSWDSRKVSKHHYALEFSKSSNVFFLNPPKFSFFNPGITFSLISKSLTLVSIHLPIPSFFKFKFEIIFNFLLTLYLKKLLKQIEPVDFLWNFDNGTYFKQDQLFQKSIKVFHPVDDFEISDKFNYSSYNIGFSVSNEILSKIPLTNKFLINHGVSDIYFSNKRYQLVKPKIKPEKVVYVGNLSIRFLDTATLIKLILDNNDIQFEFVGDYDVETKFIQFLKTQKNVILSGYKFGDELEDKLHQADILLICYKILPGYSGDNSHKVLEYLCTGNVIVSSMLSVYKELNLFPILQSYDNMDYLQLFLEVKRNFKKYNSIEEREDRINYAKDNTYSKQLTRINNYLNQLT